MMLCRRSKVPIETINLKRFDESQRVNGLPIISYNLTDRTLLTAAQGEQGISRRKYAAPAD